MSVKGELVSIMIPNYNHGRFLDKCIQSALNQTYENVEIVVLDNCSEDDSISVIKKYISRGVRLLKNPTNISNRSYDVLASLTSGKYMMLLCADDYIMPDFIEKAVKVMEKYPNVGYVHGERNFINQSGDIIEIEPFFNCSFWAKGEEMLPIYLMTPVAMPSQGIIRRSSFDKIKGYDAVIPHLSADKTLWFYLSTVSDYVYIREKVVCFHIGDETQSSITVKNFQMPILVYLTIKNLLDYSRLKGYHKVLEREQEALKKFSVECLEYCKEMLVIGDFTKANEYLLFCQLINNTIVENQCFQTLHQMQNTKTVDMDYLADMEKAGFEKKRNYEPPMGFQSIEV